VVSYGQSLISEKSVRFDATDSKRGKTKNQIKQHLEGHADKKRKKKIVSRKKNQVKLRKLGVSAAGRGIDDTIAGTIKKTRVVASGNKGSGQSRKME